MAAGKKVRELRWPLLGVVRRTGHEETVRFAEPYPSPYSLNCRTEDQIAHRLRGGSRPGLTEYSNDVVGQTISSMLSVPTASATDVSAKLVMVSNGTLGVMNNGTYSAPVGLLITEGNDTLLTEGNDTLLADTGGVPATCFLVARGQKVYAVASAETVSLDPTTGVVDSLPATDGTAPTGVTLGCVYRDRLVLAGSDNTIYLSRQGDPTDWDIGADVEDSGRPIAFQLSESAEIGDVPTALVPFQDAALLAATQYGLWVIQGDPGAGGTLRNVSRGVGCIRSTAWCLVQDARVGDAPIRHAIVFLATDGLYMVSPTGTGLQSISENRLPEELIDIAATTTVSLLYSPIERGIYVFLTPTSGTATHYFFDLVTKSFWPMHLQADHQPLAVCFHEGDVVLGSKDGYLRTVGGDDDDGTDIQSHVLIGPLRLGGANTFGILTSIHGMIGDGSDPVTWRIIPGTTAEEACDNGRTAVNLYVAGSTSAAEAYAKAHGTWTEGRSTTRYPRVRSMWAVIWLQSSGPWAYEGCNVESSLAGNWR